jgi:hypothetical protein
MKMKMKIISRIVSRYRRMRRYRDACAMIDSREPSIIAVGASIIREISAEIAAERAAERGS